MTVEVTFMEKGKLTVLETNIIYLAAALLLITAGRYVQLANIRIGLIITEYILVLLPVVIILKIKNINLSTFLRFNKIKIKHGLIIIVITLLTYPIASFFNSIILTTLSYFGASIKPLPVPMAHNLKEYIILFFIIAVSAGICEEVFFRGLLLKVYEERYKATGIVITAIMFGIFHFNLQNLAAPIVLGLVFGYLVHITNSIYAGIIGHITNNGFAVTLMYGLNVLRGALSKYSNVASEDTMPTTSQLLALTVMLGFIAAICGLFVYLLIRYIKRDIHNDLYQYDIISDNDFTKTYHYNQDSIQKDENFRYIKFIPVMIVIAIYVFFSYLQLRSH